MRVAILVKEFPPDVMGGTETQTLRMAEELSQRTDHDVSVYTKAYPGSANHDPEFDLVRVPNWRVSPFVSTLTFVIWAFVYLLRDSRDIDVLHCMMIYPTGFVGYLLRRVRDIPYFAWIRGGDYYFMKDTPIKRWAIDRVLRDTLVLTQSDGIKRDVLQEFPDAHDVRVLGNGVEIPEKTADGESVVFVGRLVEQKGVDVLLRAMETIDAPLLIVGDGPERSELEALASELEVDAHFVGEVKPEEVNEYLRRGEVFVLPSVRGEGLPNAVLEAMAIGLPVVGTDTGGVADVIQDGETGLVVEPGDVSGLEDAIKTLCDDHEFRQRLAANARERAIAEYRWPAIIGVLTAIYEELQG